LPQFQYEFRKLVGHFIAEDQLTVLDQYEQQILAWLWPLWYFFIKHPHRSIKKAKDHCTQAVHDILDRIKERLTTEPISDIPSNVYIKIISETLRWEENSALWIALDGEDTINLYSSAETVITALNQILNSGSDLQPIQETVNMYWNYIVIIPLVQGKALMPTAWCLHSRTLAMTKKQEIFTSWQSIMQPVAKKNLESAGITLWDNPLFENVHSFISAFTQLTSLVGHGKDIISIPADEQEELDQLQSYMNCYCKHLSEVLQKVFDSMSMLLDEYNGLNENEKNKRQWLTQAVSHIVELSKHLKPSSAEDDIFSIKLSELTEWFNKLDAHQYNALLAYLSWAQDILERIINIS
jgi:hypothetical protein